VFRGASMIGTDLIPAVGSFLESKFPVYWFFS
jgi:hypothetical protein